MVENFPLKYVFGNRKKNMFQYSVDIKYYFLISIILVLFGCSKELRYHAKGAPCDSVKYDCQEYPR